MTRRDGLGRRFATDFGCVSAIALIVYAWQAGDVVRVATVHRAELDRVEAYGQVWRWDGARPERVD